jgi:hypothetical protein
MRAGRSNDSQGWHSSKVGASDPGATGHRTSSWTSLTFGVNALLYLVLFSVDLITLRTSGRRAWSSAETAYLGMVAIAAVLAVSRISLSWRAAAAGVALSGALGLLIATVSFAFPFAALAAADLIVIRKTFLRQPQLLWLAAVCCLSGLTLIIAAFVALY